MGRDATEAERGTDLRDLVENLPAIVFEMDPDGRLSYVNRRARETFGIDELTLGEAVSVLDLVVPEDRQRALRNIGANVRGEGRGPNEYTIVTGGGTLTPVLIQSSPILEGGRVVGVRGLVVDLTERRRVEDLQREGEARLRTLLSAFPDLIVRLDTHGTYRDLFTSNPEVLVLPAEELIGRSIHDVLPAELAERIERSIDEASATGSPVELEYELDVQAGRRHFETRFVFSAPDDIFLIVRDVTQKKRAEARLALADRLASLGTLAAGIAHEINNPLTYVLGNLELMEETVRRLRPQLGDEADLLLRSLASAQEGSERVRRIVSDLRAFARPHDDDLHPVDVRAVVESALALAANEIRHRARLVRDFEEVPPVAAAEHRLAQVFLNLLVNAAQALPDGEADRHEIRVTIRAPSPDRVEVAVADDGPGIPAHLQPRIFDPFVTTKRSGRGMGLGLSIAHSTVTSLGGEILLTSRPGRGTTFTVSLQPVHDAAAEPAPASAPVVEHAEPLSVLVVDDEPLVVDTLQRALAGHRLVTARSGREALELLREGTFDVVLCDLMMPELSGIDVYTTLQRVRPDLARRFAFVTGGAFIDRARAFLARSDVPVLRKPFRVAEVRALVEKLGRQPEGGHLDPAG